MRYFKEHYRELLNKLNFFRNKRFIYQEAPRPPMKVEAKTEAPETKPKAPAEPKKPDDWKKFQDKFDKHMDPFKKLDSAKVNKFVDQFRADLAKLKNEYATRIGKELQPDVDRIMHPQVDNLIGKINTRIRTEGGTPVEAKPAAPEVKKGVEVKKKSPITLDNIFSLESADHLAISDALLNLVLKDYKSFIESLDLNKEKTNQLRPLEKGIQSFVKEMKDIRPLFKKGNYDEYFKKSEQVWVKHKSTVEKFSEIAGEPKNIRHTIETAYNYAMKSKDYPDKDKLKTSMGKLEGIAKAKTEKGPEQAVTLQGKQLEDAFKIVAKNVTDKYVQGELKKTLANVKFTPEQIKQLGKGKLEMTPDQLKQIREAMFGKKSGRENLKPASKEEFKLVKEFTSWTKLDDFFDDFEDPAFVYLSQKYTITGPDKGKKGIKIDGKPVEDIKDLKQYMPENMKDNFDKALNGKLDDKGQKELLDDLKGRVKTNEAMMKLQKELLSKENLGKIEKAPGAMEGLALLLQLFRAIQKAFKDGDWETLGDFMNDWKQAKNPKEMVRRMNESKESYGKALDKNKPKDINVLLKAYLKPRGKEANQLFGEKGPSSKYRNEAKPAIANYLQTNLNLSSIAEIKQLPNGFVEIAGYQKDTGNKIAVEINLSGDKPKARILPFGERTKTVDGKETTEEFKSTKDSSGKEIPFEEITLKTLGEKLGKKPEPQKAEVTPPATPDKPAEKPQKPKQAPEKPVETIDYAKLLEGLENVADPKEPKEHNVLYAIINSVKTIPGGKQPEWKEVTGKTKAERQAALNQKRREFILQHKDVYEPVLKAVDKLAKLEATPDPKEKSENNDLQKIINQKNVKGKRPSWAKLRRIANPTERQSALDSQRRAFILKNYDAYKDVIEGKKKK